MTQHYRITNSTSECFNVITGYWTKNKKYYHFRTIHVKWRTDDNKPKCNPKMKNIAGGFLNNFCCVDGFVGMFMEKRKSKKIDLITYEGV